MKICILLYFFFLLYLNGYSQTITGTVNDPNGVVAGALVTVINIESQKIVSFTSSDEKGKYKIKLPNITEKLSALAIRVQLLGYAKLIIGMQDGRIQYDFTLFPESTLLPDVIVKDKSPHAVVRGDTLSYKVSEFSRTQDRSIGDVLKRMPGIAVDHTGKIFYNGKAITRFYIDGDNLLDDKYNIGTNAIPDTIVDKVQILENHEPIKMRRESSTSAATALNITLKEGMSQKPIFKLMLGAGYPATYDGNLTNILLNKNSKAINQLKVNNVGLDLVSDLKSHDKSNFEALTDMRLPDALLAASSVNYPSIDKKWYLFNNTGLLNTNNLYNLKNGFQLKAKLSYLFDRQEQAYQNLSKLIIGKDSIIYNEDLSSILQPKNFSSEFNLNANKSSYFLDNTLVSDFNSGLNKAQLFSNDRVSSQNLSFKSNNFSNQFKLIQKLRANNSWELHSYISKYNSPQNLRLSPSIFPAGYNLPVILGELYQKLSLPGLFTRNSVALDIPAVISQNYKIGVSTHTQNLHSILQGKSFNSDQYLTADSGLNNFDWDRTKFFADLNYRFITKSKNPILSLRLPLSYLKTKFINYSTDRNLFRRSKLYFDPELNFVFEPIRENIFNINYKFTNDPGRITDFYSGYILTNYRTIRNNNSSYHSYRQSATLGYTFRKSAQLLFINLGASFINQKNNTIQFSQISNNFSITSSINAKANRANSLLLTSGISKYLFNLSTTISGNYSWQYSRSNQFFNTLFSPYELFEQNVSLIIDSKVNKDLFLKYSSSFTGFKSVSANNMNQADINRLNQIIEFTYSAKERLFIKTNFNHLYSSISSQTSMNNVLADASLLLQLKNIRADLELGLTNIGNVRGYEFMYVETNHISTSSYLLRPRTGILRVTFQL